MPDTAQQDAPEAQAPLPPPRMREREPKPEQPVVPPAEAVRALGADKPPELSAENQHSALEWFLNPDPNNDVVPTRTIEINVGVNEPHWIKWVIQAVDVDMLKRIQRESAGNRASRRAGAEMDEITASARIIVEATVEPDVRAAASSMGIRDPAEALRMRFSKKPGLLGQITAEIFSLSGYDDEDVREAQAASN